MSWNGQVHPAAEVFPMLEGDEMDALAASIRTHGLREPCWLAKDGTLLDGRNRIHACKLANVEPRFRMYEGDDQVAFIVSLNIDRRHLSPGQRTMVGVELLPHFEAEAAARYAATVGRPKKKSGATLHQISEPKKKRAPKAAEMAAKAVGVSARSIAKGKKIKEQAPELADQVFTGALTPARAERIVRDREAEEKAAARATATEQAQLIGTRVDVRHGDFREVLADLSGVEAIITDPPYPREYLDLLPDLAAWADKVLTDDGVLAVLFGQTHLPDVYRLLDGYRPYRWTMAYLTLGAGYASHPRAVQSNWKPVLVYGGGRRFADVLRSEGTDASAKHQHKWGQDFAAFHTLVERLTEPGHTVVDPFMGSGTTLAAAKALGRHAIGCDVDLAHVETARSRLR